ncbi:MAG: immunoglobulin-like domain-containing protein, partial [Acholeplasmataceae bacterium]
MKRFIVVVFLLLFVLVGCRENTVDKIKKEINIMYVENDNETSVGHNFYVPLNVLGYEITWASNSHYVEFINDKGVIKQSDKDETVLLKASFSYLEKIYEKDFTIVISKSDVVNTPFDFNTIIKQISIPTSTTKDLLLPKEIDGVLIQWSSNHEAINNDGVIYRQDDDILVTLTATLEYEEETHTLDYQVTVLKQESAKPFDFSKVIEKITIPTLIEGDITLPTEIDGVMITWVSNKPLILSNEGVVVRQSTHSDVRLSATLSKDEFVKDVSYDVVVLKETTQIDYQAILDRITLPLSTDVNLVLPTSIDNVMITWFSHHQNITNTGIITQGDNDISVQLTAIAGDVEKLFDVLILKKSEGIISTKTPIADVRAMSEGVMVEVHGIVTSHMTNGNYTIEDSTGAIPVYFGSNNEALVVGSVYVIEGELSSFQGLKQIGTNIKTPTIKQNLGTEPLPSVKDLSGYSLNYDDVTLYEGYVITYRNLEVIEKAVVNNALEFTVKNEAGETTNARLDQR